MKTSTLLYDEANDTNLQFTLNQIHSTPQPERQSKSAVTRWQSETPVECGESTFRPLSKHYFLY